MKQLALFTNQMPKTFGGESLKGRRKTQRLLSTRAPLHLVLKSSDALKKGGFFLKRKWIETEIKKASHRWGVRVFEQAIAGNHIHLAIQVPDRLAYQKFIQRLTGILAKCLKIRFDHRPFTRIVSWGRDFQHLRRYIQQNIRECVGSIFYQPRGRGSLRKKEKWEERMAQARYYEPSDEDLADILQQLCVIDGDPGGFAR